MKIMTYNVYRGGEERFPQILEIIKDRNPDILCVQEACQWLEESRLKETARVLDIPANQILYTRGNSGRSSSGHIYDLAVFSKLPVLRYEIKRDPEKIWHALIAFDIEIPELGQTRIINAHLSPQSVAWRKKELAIISDLINRYKEKPVILLGDLNDLSPADPYPPRLAEELRKQGITKFGNPPKFELLEKLSQAGFEDYFKFEITVLEESEDKNHLNLRLDYLLTKNIPREKIARCYVLNTPKAKQASDHFPVIMETGSS